MMRPICSSCVAVMLAFVAMAVPAGAQSQPPPNLSRNQRNALQTIVRAVATGAPIQDLPDSQWPVHMLRLSDGSHYVAFSVEAPPVTTAKKPVVLYVRLATHRGSTTVSSDERSGVAEWLAGQTAGPPATKRGIDFGEMPTFGAGAAAGRDPAISTRGPGPQALQLLELERKRARERREAEERQRKAELEGETTQRGPRPYLPFEDFDVRALPFEQTKETVTFRRSLTAGPGDYDLLIGIADPDAKDIAQSLRIVRRRLTLPPASMTEFALSSVIVAASARLRETPLSSDEQTAQPYTIGMLEITPAPDHQFTNDESVTLIVQVINAAGAPTGKPDVAVGFRVFRRTGDNEESIGTLAPHIFNETTLPPDFDVAKRHPIFDAVTVPLRTFRRGDYRVEIAANDRFAGIGTVTEATFTVVATPAALLRDAPPLVAPFRRTDFLQPNVLEEVLSRLSGPQPSTTFASAIASVRAGRFADLIRDDGVPAEEIDARQLLRTLAMYAIGENASQLATSLQQPLQRKVSPAAVHALLGAVHAVEGRDRDAVNGWEAAITAGASAQVLTPLIADALLRVGEPQRAADVLERLSSGNDAAVLRRLAAARIALGRYPETLRIVDAMLARDPQDVESQWLAIHALFAGLVQGQGPGSDAAGRARIRDLVTQYTVAKGRHATLAAEWAAAVR